MDASVTTALPELDAERLLASFLELIQIDSPSLSEGALAQHCQQIFTELGMTTQIDTAGTAVGGNTGNLIATLPATAGRSDRLYFSAHLDTVEPGRNIQPQVKDGVIRAVSPTILGGDDKVGIAAILEALRTILAAGASHPEIVVMLTICEELGLRGAAAMDGSDFHGELCFVLDAGGAPGTVIIGAPEQMEYSAHFIGKASHAGVAPAAGISAIALAARAITQLPLGQLDNETTANVGTIQGGSANNVVPDSCRITGEYRSLNAQRFAELQGQIQKILEDAVAGSGGRVETEFHRIYPGFKLEVSDSEVQWFLTLATSLGLTGNACYTGGGSDANIFAGHGLKPLVLGAGMTDVHSLDESLAVQDMVDLTRLVIAIILNYQS
ncbi:MAG: M20/M25/M40 family metallo-hydrolase [Actinomycetia bacterium]|nr:M20/M25/M40 family metallo-hydrolase [Actinomycetes bacterium]